MSEQPVPIPEALEKRAMKPTRRLASSHGILRFCGVQQDIAALLSRLSPDLGFRGYSAEFERGASAILRAIAELATEEAEALDNRRIE